MLEFGENPFAWRRLAWSATPTGGASLQRTLTDLAGKKVARRTKSIILNVMISVTGRAQQACDGFTRRDLLQLGSLAALGVTLPRVPVRASSVKTAPGFGRARACLVIYLFGGPSQLDTFDLKPDAPDQFRGEFRPIATNVPGIQICEHLPRLSQQADKEFLELPDHS